MVRVVGPLDVRRNNPRRREGRWSKHPREAVSIEFSPYWDGPGKRRGAVWYGMVRYGKARRGVVWYGMVWYDLGRYRTYRARPYNPTHQA